MLTANISAIIPFYNSSATIERCLDSIRNQSILPFEIIIINDCSSIQEKNFLDTLIKKETKLNIKKIDLKKNSGAANARNVGLDIATGKYIAFLDSDDTWEVKKLETQVKFMENKKDCFLCSHLYLHPEIDKKEFKKNFELISFRKLIFKNYFSTPTVMLLNNKEFRFKKNQRFSEDYQLWLQVAFKENCYLINEYLAKGYKPVYGHSGLSSNLFKMEVAEIINYFTLYKEQKINILLLLVATSYSFLKFIIRLFKTFLKNKTRFIKTLY